MKGIILAGGKGTRLFPLTITTSKQLLPIYDKPLIYYPLSVLMLANIKDILIITTPNDLTRFKALLGNGSNLGISIEYIEQKSPDGLAQALILGKDFVGDDDLCLILGDNIFYGHTLPEKLESAIRNASHGNASIFSYHVNNPEEYGIAEIDDNGQVISIEEKPKKPLSNYAITGLYFYPNKALHYVKDIKPSPRGELEITSLNEIFLKKEMLICETLGRGFMWMDAGSHENLLEASVLIETIERRQGLKVGSIEEIAYKKKFISLQNYKKMISLYSDNQYTKYLRGIIKDQ